MLEGDFFIISLNEASVAIESIGEGATLPAVNIICNPNTSKTVKSLL